MIDTYKFPMALNLVIYYFFKVSQTDLTATLGIAKLFEMKYIF